MQIDKVVDLSLTRISKFLNSLDSPQDKLKNVIHIAGTNGKGSTLSFLRSILEHHGYSVNTFTSPHLIDYKERFYLHGKYVTEEQINKTVSYFKTIPSYQELTPFEAIAALGFQLFYDYPADYTILETGLGGRLDATNVVKSPILNIISKIGFDHQKFLGNSLAKIAFEKAGIIKKGAVVVSDYQDPEVVTVLEQVALNNKAKFITGGKDYQVIQGSLQFQTQTFNLQTLSLLGKHQHYNAALAIASLLQLNIMLNPPAVLTALQNTKWAGRLQEVTNLYGIPNNNSTIFLDGAHNQLGGQALYEFIANYITQKQIQSVHIVFGMLKTKNLADFLQCLQGLQLTLYPVTIKDSNAYEPLDIIKVANTYNINTNNQQNIQQSLEFINRQEGKKLIIICGSLYLLGQIMHENNYIITK
ncbi:Folylpolyglutamate synthase [Candidatus Hepatincola sp. Pdp]